MAHLLIVSLVWAFSFGLIKGQLTGLDPSFVSLVRMTLSLAFFLPFLRPSRVPRGKALRLLLIGGVQFGAMYVFYIASYRYLAAHEVALFTVITPIFVVLLDDLAVRRFRLGFLGAAVLAVLGAGVIAAGPLSGSKVWIGFALVQVANACFAFGQVEYRRVLPSRDFPHHSIFALPYLGGVLVTGAASATLTDWAHLSVTRAQVATLAYLGIVASGLCFFLWNLGATRTNAGVLAVFNNAKVPLAVAVSLLFFGETTNLPRLAAGGGLVAGALWLGSRVHAEEPPRGHSVG